MDLFEMATEIKEKGLNSIDDLIINDEKIENLNLELIVPIKWKWIKFSSEQERKEKLKNYRHLGKKDELKYISNNLEIPCKIIGYLDVKKDVDYDHLVLEFKDGKLHVILTEYFSDMQSMKIL